MLLCIQALNSSSWTSILRILHDDLELFPYKIQILQRQTDQNKGEQETFCGNISQRTENDPGLLDLNDLNNVNNCALWGASDTLPVSRNLVSKRWIVLLSCTLFLPKTLLYCCCVRRTDFVAKYASMIFNRCCVVNRLVGSILMWKESPRPAVYTTWKVWKICKTQLWDEKQNRALFLDHPVVVKSLLHRKIVMSKEDCYVVLKSLPGIKWLRGSKFATW